MTLKEQIGKDMLAAMKNKDSVTRDVLRVIKAEISREEGGLKEFDDTDVIKLINKTIKNLKEVPSDSSNEEIEVLSKYVPQPMTETEVEEVLEGLVITNNYTQPKDMGNIMGYFKENYPGRADGKTISKVFKKIISQ